MDSGEKLERFLAELSRAERLLRSDGPVSATRQQRILQHLRRLGRAPGSYTRYLLAHLGLLGEASTVTSTFWGAPMSMPLRDGDATGVYFFGILAGPEYRLIRYLIRTLRSDDIFYDVGANYGFYSMLAQELIEKGEVHAFEPLPGVFGYLERNASATSQVFLNNVALAERLGNAQMFDMSEAGHSGGSTVEPSVGGRMKTAILRTVPSTTLDVYCQTHKAPTVMKLDVEGGEHLVLKGGMEMLRREKPIIVMEVWSGEKGQLFSSLALQVLQDMGYRGRILKESGDVSEDRAPLEFLTISEADNIVFEAHERS